ncbi:MAG: DPP IV N-terminal domain-containing protein [Candidatus Omnitrophota bacterium]
MNKKNVCFIFILILFSCIFLMGYTLSASPSAVSIETAFDNKFLSKLNTPTYMWLQNGNVLLLDSRVDPEQRTLEILNPKTGKKEKYLEASKLLNGLKKEIKNDPPNTLSWPDAIDQTGTQAIYILDNDLFWVELSTGAVKRLTRTPSAEESVTFSPDGRWVSFIRNNDIYMINPANGEEKKLTEGSSDTLLNGKLSWVYWEELYNHTTVPYAWSPDSKAIAYLQSDESEVPRCTFVHYKPTTPTTVTQRYPKAGQPNPKVRAGIVEIDQAKTTWLDCRNYEYIAGFDWTPDSRHIAIQTLNRPQSDLKLWLLDRQKGTGKIIIEEHQPTWVNINQCLYFFKKSNRFLWMSERDGYQHLYLYSLTSNNNDCHLLGQVTRGEFMVVSSPGARVNGNSGLVAVDEKNEWVYFTSNQTNLRERHLYRIKINGKELRPLSQGNGVHTIEFSPNLNYYLDTYSHFSKPGELNLHQANGKKINVVAPASLEILTPWKLQTPEFHGFKTRDGLELPIMALKPLDYNPNKTYPALLYIYGGPGNQQVIDGWSNRNALWYNILNREGFFVFVLDVRAGEGKSKAIESSAYKHAYGIQNLNDILDGVEWIKKIPGVDPHRLGIWGGSGGGTTTLYVMTHSDVFKAGISLFPVTDWTYYDSIYTERYLSTPQENPDGYKETSTLSIAHQLKGHLLIAHGTYDDNVHPQNTFAFTDQLIDKNIQFDLMIYPWRKHGIADYPGKIHHYTMMLNFWKQHLL